MRILVLDEEFPYPPNTGKRIRSYNLLRRIASNHELHYMAYGKEESNSFRKFKEIGMNPIAVKTQLPRKEGIGFYFRLAMNLFSGLPYVVTSHYSDIFQNAVYEFVEKQSPDMIICEWTPYAAFVKNITDVKRVVVAHNVETRIWKRYFGNESDPAKKWYIGKQMVKLEKFERDVFQWADGATAVSEIDADDIHSFNHRLSVEVVDNGVDLDFFKPSEGKVRPKRMVFVGTMDWRPNQDAVKYFINEIFPAVREKHPGAEIYMVGRNAPNWMMEYNSMEGVTITGSVDDVRPFIDEAQVYVVPLRIGSGTRLKILDAMAMEKPIVSTTVGAEGLKVNDGEEILLADSPGDFTQRIDRLFSDAELRKTLSEKGRKLVEERYGWDNIAGRLEKFLISLTEV